MKRFASAGLALLLLAMLLAIYQYMGIRVFYVASFFAALWFSISMILLARPPGMPEFVTEEPGSDEQYVVRRDVVPKLPLADRFQLSLAVACGSCFLVWTTLVALAV